jgi:hypothetical protein
MQGVLTSREAWTRFACALFQATELTQSEIASECDKMLEHYLERFPDPPGRLESARLTRTALEYLKPDSLTEDSEDAPSEDHV